MNQRARALGPMQALRESWRIFWRRPVAMLSLGAALSTSLAAVCCGLGFFAAPWFMCELFALQIGSEAGESPRRTRAWFAAGALQFCGVLVLGVLAFLTALALGPDALIGAVERVPRSIESRLFASLWSTGFASACALLATVHFQYAPAILIERGGRLYGAVLESAALVRESGSLRTWLSSVTAHALPIACFGLGLSGQLAVAGTRVFTVFLLLVTVPLLALATAIGQGMIVANFLAVRDPSPALRSLRAPPAAGALHFVLLGSFLLGSLLLLTALGKPAPLAPGELPSSSPVLVEAESLAATRVLYLPDSALRIELAPERVQVVASDGGGTGALPLPPERGRVKRVRVGRWFLPSRARRSSLEAGASGFAIELDVGDGAKLLAMVDESGVRVDDSLRRRYAFLLPGRAGLLLGLCWMGVVAWSACMLPRAAASARASRTVTLRDALSTALWLVPPAAVSLGLGLWLLMR